MNTELTKTLQQITNTINNTPNYWAELDPDQNEYLIRFHKQDSQNCDCLVLMYDHGITWEPLKAYPTPKYCQINITNPQQAAQNMMRLADAHANGELPIHTPEGEGAGEKYLQ